MAIRFGEHQLRIIEHKAIENYITELVVLCNEIYPHLEVILGKEQLRDSLKIAVAKAKDIGFNQSGTAQFYINMLILFGTGFETDPQCIWIQTLLEQNEKLPQLERVNILHEQVIKYLNSIMGEENEYLLACGANLQMLTLDSLGIRRSSYMADVNTLLFNIYPEKYRATKKENLLELIKQGTLKAENTYQLREPNHVAYIVLLTFLLGHQFDQDLFYQWVSKGVLATYITDDDTFIKNLEKKAKTWLDIVIKVNNDKIRRQQ